MRGALNAVAKLIAGERADAEMFPWHRLEYQHVQAVRSRLQEEYSPAYVNKILSAVRGVTREAWRLGLTDSETHQRIQDVEGVSADPLPSGRRLSRRELDALRRACEEDEGPIGLRDLALVALLARAGLRRSEAVDLDLEDVRPLEDQAAEAEVLVQSGKGRKGRLVPLAGGAATAVERWMEVRGEEPGPLLCPVRKGGAIEVRRLTPQAIYNRLRRRAEEAGLENFSPHDLRRTYISDVLDAGGDLAVAQQLAGHADPSTTARYDHRGEKAKREAVAALEF